MSGDEHDMRVVVLSNLPLQLQTVDVGKLHVQHQAGTGGFGKAMYSAALANVTACTSWLDRKSVKASRIRGSSSTTYTMKFGEVTRKL